MTETTPSLSKFFLLDEVRKCVRLSNPTLWRQERAGQFPRRRKLGARKVAYLREEIEAWEADPEGWVARSRV